MHEDFLQFVWAKGLFDQNALITIEGESIQVENRGNLNNISGPDFSEALIRIDGQLWAGSVEVHIRSSLWNAHAHECDKAYNNVVLHVVYEHDVDVHNQRGEKIPTLELKGRIPASHLKRYEALRLSKESVACAAQFSMVPRIDVVAWLDRLLVERVERKTKDIALIWKHAQNDWMQTFWILWTGYLGQNSNKLPFQELARAVPVSMLLKMADEPLHLEAVLFGCSGLLPKTSQNEYVLTLRNDFKFLQKKHGLHTISQQWKTGGQRPDANPVRRIALLAAVVSQLAELHESLIHGDKAALQRLKVDTNEYWRNHYTFLARSEKPLELKLGEALIHILEINVIVPYLYFYGQQTGNQQLMDEAIGRLENMHGEQNQMTRQWKRLGFTATSAAHSQALIELTTQYCNPKKCVLCNVGKHIIQKS